MRTLVCCVTLSFFCLGIVSAGWSQREVPPPTDLPLDSKPPISQRAPSKPLAPGATSATAKTPAARTPAALPPVAQHQADKKPMLAKTALAQKSAPKPMVRKEKRVAKAPAAQKNLVASTPKKSVPQQTAKKKLEATKAAKKPAAKKVHQASTIPGQ